MQSPLTWLVRLACRGSNSPSDCCIEQLQLKAVDVSPEGRGLPLQGAALISSLFKLLCCGRTAVLCLTCHVHSADQSLHAQLHVVVPTSTWPFKQALPLCLSGKMSMFNILTQHHLSP